MKIKQGKVYIVGAGPGDPELISVKGLNALKKADCILYDFLSSPLLLKYAKKKALKMCVGKADKLHLKEQDEINELLYEFALKFKNVVRLKGGDPFVFSRGFEEASYLSQKGIEFEVIPGITSAIAGPESFGIPLTVKNKFQSFAILTGRKSDSNAKIDTPLVDTLIYVMAVKNLRNIIKALRESGRVSSTPCAFIERATSSNQRIIKGNLATIENSAKKYNLQSPAVFIVGGVIEYKLKDR